MKGVGADAIVNFNQGYVFDYQAASTVGVNKIKVTDTYIDYSAAGDLEFYVEITTGPNSAKVTSAVLKQEEIESDEYFHYSAKGLADESIAYTDGEGVFRIPVCKIKDGNIKEIYLRENIHWQKINFESVEGPEDQTETAQSVNILANYGTDTSFGDSPTVKFKKIITEDEHLIEVQKSSGGKHVRITSKIPKPPALPSLLHWNDQSESFVWLSADPTKVQILTCISGNLTWFDGPNSSEGQQVLASNANADSLEWMLTEECVT